MARAASALIGLAAVPFLGVLALTLPQAHRGLGFDQLALFYAVPVVATSLLLWALGRPASTRISVALLLLVSASSGYAAEAGLTLYARETATRPSSGPDGETIHSLTLALRQRGDHAFPTIPGNILVDSDVTLSLGERRLHPLAPSPAFSTAVLCNERVPPITYRSDRYGFNNSDSAWSADSTTLVLIGDSYTHGVCVPAEGQLAHRLAERWPALNLASRGAGPLEELAILREFGSMKKPRVVVWIYYEGNDLYDLEREEGRAWLTAYLDPTHTQGLAREGLEFDSAYGAWIDSLMVAGPSAVGTRPPPPPLSEAVRGMLRMRALRDAVGIVVEFPDRGSRLGLLPTVLDRANSDVTAWGGELLVAYMPAYQSYRTRVGEGFHGRGELAAFAAASGLTLIDLHEVFSETDHPRSLWAHPQGHLNEEGYRVAADAIAEAVQRSLDAAPSKGGMR